MIDAYDTFHDSLVDTLLRIVGSWTFRPKDLPHSQHSPDIGARLICLRYNLSRHIGSDGTDKPFLEFGSYNARGIGNKPKQWRHIQRTDAVPGTGQATNDLSIERGADHSSIDFIFRHSLTGLGDFQIFLCLPDFRAQLPHIVLGAIHFLLGGRLIFNGLREPGSFSFRCGEAHLEDGECGACVSHFGSLELEIQACLSIILRRKHLSFFDEVAFFNKHLVDDAISTRR